MENQNNKTSISLLKFSNVYLALILIGILIIALSQFLEGVEKFHIHLDRLIAEIGALLAVTGGLHWLFNFYISKSLLRESAEEVSRAVHSETINVINQVIEQKNILNAGLSNLYLQSKSVNYKDEILSCENLIIGVHFSTRFVDDYYEDILNRAKKGKKSKIILLDICSDGGKYIISKQIPSDHIKPNVIKVKSIVEEINKQCPQSIGILEYDAVLSYSFVYTERKIWVKPYRNSRGKSKIPAFEIKSPSPLFDFYSDDINGIVKEINNHNVEQTNN